jgi:hypothetical protein
MFDMKGGKRPFAAYAKTAPVTNKKQRPVLRASDSFGPSLKASLGLIRAIRPLTFKLTTLAQPQGGRLNLVRFSASQVHSSWRSVTQPLELPYLLSESL